ALGLTVASVGVATASDHRARSHDASVWAVRGVVTAASTTSITITRHDGTPATFSIDSTTTVSEGATTVTPAALMTGERVLVVPSATTSGLAARIRIGLTEVRGQVSAVSGNSITVTTHHGFSVSVLAGSTTTFTLGGAAATLADVKVGAFLSATGVVDTSANVIDALKVRIASTTPRAWVVGKVTGVSGNTITVALRSGLSVSVVVSSSTTFSKGGSAATISDVTVGAYIEAVGTVDTTANALDATTVRIGAGDGDSDDASMGLGATLFTSGLGTQFSGQFSSH
ncbi:MAG: hypothetical protein KGJ36_04720, partial [Acidobacteriota bacterium]|nr:hypothetical protein [Acidobacteriota bacterium]